MTLLMKLLAISACTLVLSSASHSAQVVQPGSGFGSVRASSAIISGDTLLYMSTRGRITINGDGDAEHVDANSSQTRFRFTGTEELGSGMTVGVRIEEGPKPCCKPFCCPSYFRAGFVDMDETTVKYANPGRIRKFVDFVVDDSGIVDPFAFLEISGDPSDADDFDIDLDELIESVYPDPTEFLQDLGSDELRLNWLFGFGYIGYGDNDDRVNVSDFLPFIESQQKSLYFGYGDDDASVYGRSSVRVWNHSPVDTDSTHFGSGLFFNGYSLGSPIQ